MLVNINSCGCTSVEFFCDDLSMARQLIITACKVEEEYIDKELFDLLDELLTGKIPYIEIGIHLVRLVNELRFYKG